MITKMKIALAAVIVIGTAAAAMAGDQTDERGGYLVPGSMEGVNPVYHPEIFNAYAKGRISKPTVQRDRSSSGKPATTR
ncbi:MAG TPA: hypothetical protein VKW08_13355 [Xanthobacteraceae bacterium]|jgi:hypothetical protein|nr:hypothetical protein [Xanthobacteraceae bacterium]